MIRAWFWGICLLSLFVGLPTACTRPQIAEIPASLAPRAPQATPAVETGTPIAPRTATPTAPSQPSATPEAAQVLTSTVVVPPTSSKSTVVETATATTGTAIGSRGLNAFSQAAKFGIRSCDELKTMIRDTGLEAHHLIEERFAKRLGLKEVNIPCVALTQEEHRKFTDAWRKMIGYDRDSKPVNTTSASRADVWSAAQRIYADYPELLRAVQEALFEQ